MIYSGSCHCGEIKFNVEAPEDIDLFECNCSICYKQGALNIRVNKNNFKLLSNIDNITEYQFHTKTATYYFCKICGVSPFHIPRKDPETIMSVNFRCIDNASIDLRKITKVNGKEWI
jgi:hypothetical protein